MNAIVNMTSEEAPSRAVTDGDRKLKRMLKLSLGLR